MHHESPLPTVTPDGSTPEDISDRATAVNVWYDQQMFKPYLAKYSHHYDFHNYGYWRPKTRTRREASENLLEKLLAFIPEKRGSILDVACGKGASSRHLLKYYPSESVTGINISSRQIERSRLNAPGCQFLLMDATRLLFPDNSFENAICVESAFHFDTRETFFREAHRVLKPGGQLAIADILFTEAHQSGQIPANYVRGPRHYKQLLFDVGFQSVEIENATYECWSRFLIRALRISCNAFAARLIDERTFMRRTRRLLNTAHRTRYYLLASALKGS